MDHVILPDRTDLCSASFTGDRVPLAVLSERQVRRAFCRSVTPGAFVALSLFVGAFSRVSHPEIQPGQVVPVAFILETDVTPPPADPDVPTSPSEPQPAPQSVPQPAPQAAAPDAAATPPAEAAAEQPEAVPAAQPPQATVAAPDQAPPQPPTDTADLQQVPTQDESPAPVQQALAELPPMPVPFPTEAKPDPAPKTVEQPPDQLPLPPPMPFPVHSVIARPVPARRKAAFRPEVSQGAAPAAPQQSVPSARSVAAPTPSEFLALKDRIRAAVQAAVACPMAARMMHQSGTASVAFDYKAGALSGDAVIIHSSGAPVLDRAALAAVREARYPPPPGQSTDLLRLLVRVEADCG